MMFRSGKETSEKKRAVLVTLIDQKYVDAAKQMFSSVYHNAGWQGDYLVMAQGVSSSDLCWFRERGVFVYEIEPLLGERLNDMWSDVVYSKLYLFSEYFRQWEHVVYIDSDAIVRSSLDRLLSVTRLSAVSPSVSSKLSIYMWNYLNDYDRAMMRKLSRNEYYELRNEIELRCSLGAPAFNSGLLAFPTSIIKPDTFECLLGYLRRYGRIMKADDGIMNLFFFDNWQSLPEVYNYDPMYSSLGFHSYNSSACAVVIHFVYLFKPWMKDNPYYFEWIHNLNRSDNIDFKKNRSKAKRMSRLHERFYSFFPKVWSNYFSGGLLFVFDQISYVLNRFASTVFHSRASFGSKTNSHVLVTLADSTCLDAAKQLFYSAYQYGGWDGDYILLSYGNDEGKLSWFLDRGIHVIQVEHIQDSRIYPGILPSTVFAKFYLFSDFFKKWDRVVFLDADIIVRGTLEGLTRCKGFCAGYNLGLGLREEFTGTHGIYKRLGACYDLSQPSFCSGVMSFDTSFITSRTVSELFELYRRYGAFTTYGEQGIFNLYFANRFSFLPFTYNIPMNFSVATYSFLSRDYSRGHLLHFMYLPKPWQLESPFYAEWKRNLIHADSVNFGVDFSVGISRSPFRRNGLRFITLSHWEGFIRGYIEPKMGEVGRIMKDRAPLLYKVLKKIIYDNRDSLL